MENSTKAKINIVDPVPFNPVGDIKITSTTELSKVINDVFSQAFADYYGCNLSIQFQPDRQQYIVVPMLYFKVLKKEAYTNDGIFCFTPLGANANANDIIGRVSRLSQTATTGQKVSMTKEGMEILEDFAIAPALKNQKFDWETAYRTIPTETETFIMVFKLDINKFIAKIFGDKDETGSAAFYQITPAYVIGANNQYKKPDNWCLNVLRLHYADLSAAADMVGLYVSQDSGMPNVITEGTKK